jgi:hypothetical protein
MKWFFLALLVLFTFGVEMLIIGSTPQQLSPDRMAAAAAFALFCLALSAHWRASYFLEGATQARGSEFAHSILILSLGAYCIVVGGEFVISEACAFPLPAGETSMDSIRLLADITAYLQERGWCAALGYFFLLLGGALSWPTLKLSFGAFVKKARHPPL